MYGAGGGRDEDGRIRVPSRKEENRWTQVSLDGLGRFLKETVKDFDAKQRKQGKGREQKSKQNQLFVALESGQLLCRSALEG